MNKSIRLVGVGIALLGFSFAMTIAAPPMAEAYICCVAMPCNPPCTGEDGMGHKVSGNCVINFEHECDYLGYCECQ